MTNHWAYGNKIVNWSVFETSNEYFIPAGEESKATEEKLGKNALEHFLPIQKEKEKRAFADWIVNLTNEDDMAVNWKQVKCTFKTFFKHCMCKHLVDLAIRLKYVKPRQGSKRKTKQQKFY